jgi:hypothetical protein
MKLDRPIVLWYLALFAIFTAIGIFFTFHTYLGDMDHSALIFRHHLLDEMTGARTIHGGGRASLSVQARDDR